MLEVPKGMKRLRKNYPCDVWFNDRGFIPLLAGSPVRITIWESDGRVVYDSCVNAAAMENHGTRVEQTLAVTGCNRLVGRISRTTGMFYYYWAFMVSLNGMVRIVRFGAPSLQPYTQH